MFNTPGCRLDGRRRGAWRIATIPPRRAGDRLAPCIHFPSIRCRSHTLLHRRQRLTVQLALAGRLHEPSVHDRRIVIEKAQRPGRLPRLPLGPNHGHDPLTLVRRGRHHVPRASCDRACWDEDRFGPRSTDDPLNRPVLRRVELEEKPRMLALLWARDQAALSSPPSAAPGIARAERRRCRARSSDASPWPRRCARRGCRSSSRQTRPGW